MVEDLRSLSHQRFPAFRAIGHSAEAGLLISKLESCCVASRSVSRSLARAEIGTVTNHGMAPSASGFVRRELPSSAPARRVRSTVRRPARPLLDRNCSLCVYIQCTGTDIPRLKANDYVHPFRSGNPRPSRGPSALLAAITLDGEACGWQLQCVPEDVCGDIRIPDGEWAYWDIYGAESDKRVGEAYCTTLDEALDQVASLMEHRQRIQDMQQRLTRQQ
jgi:hypothetical protein